MDTSKAIFEKLTAEGLALLERWRDEVRQEDLYLEFKEAKSPMEKPDKQNLAAAISGFANSDGGVIVWGGMAAKDENGIDALHELRPIRGIRRFLSNLTEYVSRLVVPAVPGVENHIILDPAAADDVGYAVTYVPKGDGLPHMAMAQGQQRYYYRTGDSFLPMEHFMLADRFGRRPQPKLELTWWLQRIVDHIYVVVSLTNVGRGIALYPAIELTEDTLGDARVVSLNNAESPGFGLPERPKALQSDLPSWRVFAGTGNHAIHPGTSIDVFQVGYWDASLSGTHSRSGPVARRNIPLRYNLYCDGFTLVNAVTVIPAEDINAYARRY